MKQIEKASKAKKQLKIENLSQNQREILGMGKVLASGKVLQEAPLIFHDCNIPSVENLDSSLMSSSYNSIPLGGNEYVYKSNN